MGRIGVSKEDFMKAYETEESVLDMAIKLGVSEMTVRNYLKRFGLVAKQTKRRQQQATAIYDAYKGSISIPALAVKFGVDENAIRYNLRRRMIEVYSAPNPPKWPRPQLLAHIKILHLLEERPEMADMRRVTQIADELELTDYCVSLYLSRVQAMRDSEDEKSKKAKKSKKATTKKRVVVVKKGKKVVKLKKKSTK